MADDDCFLDERMLIGLVAGNFDLLQFAPGLTAAHFRLKGHAAIFREFVAIRDQGHSGLNIDGARAAPDRRNRYIAALADAATKRTQGDEEHAEAIVRVRARKIIGGIRTAKDRALWYDQLFKACGRGEIGATEHLLAVAIGRHVKLATGNCFPGYALLAKETNLNVKTVERCLPTLKSTGHLYVDRGRPVIFTPTVWGKLDAAKRAAERHPAAATPADLGRQPAPNLDDMKDEIPF